MKKKVLKNMSLVLGMLMLSSAALAGGGQIGSAHEPQTQRKDSFRTVTINCKDRSGANRIIFKVDPSSRVYNSNDVRMIADGVEIKADHLGPVWDSGPFIVGNLEGRGEYSAQLQYKLLGSWTSEAATDDGDFILTQVAGVPVELKCASVSKAPSLAERFRK